jgi:hypothetical protein
MRDIMASIVMNEHDADGDHELNSVEMVSFMKASMQAGASEGGDFAQPMSDAEKDDLSRLIAIMMTNMLDSDESGSLNIVELKLMFTPGA